MERPEENVTCVFCEEQCASKQELQQHIDTIHLSLSEKCPKCSYSTSKKSHLKRHMNVHLPDKFKPKQSQCLHCSKMFSTRSNLTKHLRTVHKPDVTGVPLPQPDQNLQKVPKFTCMLCDRNYTWKSNLKRHIKTVHQCTSDDLGVYRCANCSFTTSYKHALRKHLISHKREKEVRDMKKFICSTCSRSFSRKPLLQYHRRKYHVEGKKLSVFKRNCCICAKILFGYNLDVLHSHYEKVHNIPMHWEQHSFDTIADFEAWKKIVERDTTSAYVLYYTYKSRKVYKCHRSGKYSKSGLNKREIKMSGSCKINNICPSIMKVCVKDRKVLVKYLPSHVGHKNELKHIRLTPEERKRIAVKLVEKVPHDVVLDKFRGPVTNCDLKRINLLNRKDIANIEKSFNLNDEAIKHPFDVISIEAWVKELQSSRDTAFIAYKPQGEVIEDFPNFKEEDFLLIYISEAQKNMLQRWGQDIVCIDGTHGINNYNFQLYTLLTIDETREGFPAAFMFSNKGDEETMQTFFQSVKSVSGPMKVNVFMSDMEETFYNAWKTVMGPANLRLFCTWHVLKAWRINANTKIKTKEKKESTLKILRTVLYELDKTSFLSMIDGMLSTLNNDCDTKLFAEYFRKQYVDNERFKTWAYCYRINAGINTNMSLENFNRVLKHCYLRGKTVRRLDKTLCAILNLLRDKLFDLMIKMYRGKLVTKLRVLRNRHKTSITMDDKQILQEENDRWTVLSSQQTEFYIVKRVTVCNSCSLRCIHCQSCLHEYVCSCVDNSIKNNMCKHIHLVRRAHVVTTVHAENLPNAGYDDVDGGNLIVDIENSDEIKLQDTILFELSTSRQMNYISKEDENLKTKIRDEIEQVLNGITTHDTLEYVHDMVKKISVTVCSMNEASGRLANTEIKSNGPRVAGNTKIKPQRTFFSTKKSFNRPAKAKLSDCEKTKIGLTLLQN